MTSWGPWSPTCHRDQRALQLRSLAALVAVYCGSHTPLVRTLRLAETDPMAFTEAEQAFNALPALSRRKILSMFSKITFTAKEKA